MLQIFKLEEHVKVIASGEVGRVEQWSSSKSLYLVEFNRDSSTRKWLSENELQKTECGCNY
jgi:hypothetical protein